MNENQQMGISRFLQTLNIVHREGVHLSYSWQRLDSEQIDTAWVLKLDEAPHIAEQMEAFISRFGRMQDTIAGKLLPRWLAAIEESTGSQIEILNKAEKLGVMDNVEHWLEARYLRNRLIHEYMEDAGQFAEDLVLAKEYTGMLMETYNKMLAFANNRMDLGKQILPEKIILEVVHK